MAPMRTDLAEWQKEKLKRGKCAWTTNCNNDAEPGFIICKGHREIEDKLAEIRMEIDLSNERIRRVGDDLNDDRLSTWMSVRHQTTATGAWVKEGQQAEQELMWQRNSPTYWTNPRLRQLRERYFLY
jgi:hypothetical protein